jgi:hypothetical protein
MAPNNVPKRAKSRIRIWLWAALLLLGWCAYQVGSAPTTGDELASPSTSTRPCELSGPACRMGQLEVPFRQGPLQQGTAAPGL